MFDVSDRDWKRDFLRLLEKATVANNLGARAVELKNTHLPERICRYRKDSERSRSNLKDDTVWLSSPDDYNNPFDCQTKVILGSVETALARASVRGFFTNSLRPSNLEVTPARIERNIGESIETFTNRLVEQFKVKLPALAASRATIFPSYFAQVLPTFATEAKQKAGMFRGLTKACSFSERNDSILMWSHYADYHRGFCVEYDLSAVPVDHQFRSTLYPIIYSKSLYDSTPLIVDWIERARNNWNPFFPLLGFIHKSDEWSYEKEWRLLFVTPNSEPNHAWIAPKPVRIFLGACMKDEAVKEIRAMAVQKSIEVFKMNRADDSFSLIPQRLI